MLVSFAVTITVNASSVSGRTPLLPQLFVPTDLGIC